MRQKLIRLFTQVLLDDNIMNNDIEKFNLPRENDGRGFTNLEILQHNQIASLKNYSLNRARDNTFFNALVSADKGYSYSSCYTIKSL
jgi:hypothetical protein